MGRRFTASLAERRRQSIEPQISAFLALTLSFRARARWRQSRGLYQVHPGVATIDSYQEQLLESELSIVAF